ncbi:unnamed protein product, partial [Pleuronectes platessa]
MPLPPSRVYQGPGLQLPVPLSDIFTERTGPREDSRAFIICGSHGLGKFYICSLEHMVISRRLFQWKLPKDLPPDYPHTQAPALFPTSGCFKRLPSLSGAALKHATGVLISFAPSLSVSVSASRTDNSPGCCERNQRACAEVVRSPTIPSNKPLWDQHERCCKYTQGSCKVRAAAPFKRDLDSMVVANSRPAVFAQEQSEVCHGLCLYEGQCTCVSPCIYVWVSVWGGSSPSG